jgi:hypothetical protein
LLRILRQWYRAGGDEPPDRMAKEHPLYPMNARGPGEVYGNRGPLWREVERLIKRVDWLIQRSQE